MHVGIHNFTTASDFTQRIYPPHLSGHDSLPLGDQGALRAEALAVPALPLVAPQPGDQPVVAAPRALRSPLLRLGCTRYRRPVLHLGLPQLSPQHRQ